jgi:hypothetical protein
MYSPATGEMSVDRHVHMKRLIHLGKDALGYLSGIHQAGISKLPVYFVFQFVRTVKCFL